MANADFGRHVGHCGGVVQDGPNACRDQLVHNGLGGVHRYRHNADINVVVPQKAYEFTSVSNRDLADRTSHHRWIGVERGYNFESLGSKSPVLNNRLAQPTDPNDAHTPLPVEPENLTQLVQQPGDIVTPTLFPKSSEVTEVLSYLRRRDAQGLAQRLRTDDSFAQFREREERPSVNREAVDDNFRNL